MVKKRLDGIQEVIRKPNYQRVGANQAITANGFITITVNIKEGIKAFQLAWKANAGVAIQCYPSDANGNPLLNSPVLAQATSAGGYVNGGLIVGEWGGSPYLIIVVTDKSAAANLLQFIDLWVTNI